jgi:glycerate 2-kinase
VVVVRRHEGGEVDTSSESQAGAGGCQNCQIELRLLRGLFAKACRAADPGHVLVGRLPKPRDGRYVVVGAGKAAAAMASAVERDATWPVEGMVIAPYGHGVPTREIEVVEAAHPIPDDAGVSATARLLDALNGLTDGDDVVALISGGGSALLTLPIPGLDLDEKQRLCRALLKCGAPISEINLVRTHLSAVKGGGLAAAVSPASLHTLLISDIPGDAPEMIASGPTFFRERDPDLAIAVLKRHGIDPSAQAVSAMRSHASTWNERLARPGHGTWEVVARPQASLEAAARLAADEGITPVVLGDAIEGESREVAKVMAAIARQVRSHRQPQPPPCVLLSGGETTVTVRGSGRGGRNVEFLLALAVSLAGSASTWAVAGDTDGVDGQESVAGAVVCPHTLERARTAGLSLSDALEANDAHSVFERLGDQVVTGPTLTNVNDFRAVLVR